MAYKTILTVLTDPASVAATLSGAMAVARQQGAHLDVLCIGVDRTQIGYYGEGDPGFLQRAAMEEARKETETIRTMAQGALEREDLRWSLEGVVSQMVGLTGLAALRARFADLVILPRPYGPGRHPDAVAVLEAALFEGRAPVLVLPDGPAPAKGHPPFGRRILLAWNQSNEALCAVRRAMPFLRQADLVNVTVIDPPRHGPERSDPGGALCQMLARHGIRVEISVLALVLPRVSDVIARQVRDTGSDLIVMGAYGHSRFRESILGGASRNMLQSATVPVLMAH